ncbi:MAG TPA: YceI family protein [Capillimicrobium sp.]|jgi:polyisoprenoid-binding protein YceI
MDTTVSRTAIPTGTWTIDPAHSTIGFAVRHAGIANVRGRFETFQGAIEVTESGIAIAGTVDLASVDTGVEARDDHLRSVDFFHVDEHPELRFASRDVVVDGADIEIAGDLTLRGVTRPITLRGELGGYDTDPDGDTRLGVEVAGQLSRAEFGMRFNQALGSGNVLVADRVKLILEVSAVRSDG